MELTILEILYSVLILFTIIIGSLISIILYKFVKILNVVMEIIEIYTKIKQIFLLYSKIPNSFFDYIKKIIFGKKE